MHRIHLKRNLRTLAHLLVIGAILATFSTLWWANHTGLPDSWRTGIENAFGKEGAHISIGSLSYRPLRGIVASDVSVYSDENRQHEISHLKNILLGLDKTKLARGRVELNKIQLQNATLTLPVNPADPDSGKLEVENVNGTLLMPGNQRFEFRNARGRVEGIEVVLNAKLIGFRGSGNHPSKGDRYGMRRNLLAGLLKEVAKLRFHPDSPPRLLVNLEGNANDWRSFRSKIRLTAREMEKNQHSLQNVELDAELHGPLLTVTKLHAADSRGEINARLDYDVWGRDGRFDLTSTLDIPRLLKTWFDLPPIRSILIGGKQHLEAAGDFQLPENSPPEVRMTGSARAHSLLLKGIQFDKAETLFSWRDGDLYLRDLHLARPDGQANGKVMVQWPLVRLSLQANLPTDVVQPVFDGKPLGKILGDFSPLEDASAFVDLEGGFNAEIRTSWAYTGTARVNNHAYRGVPVKSATCHMSLNTRELDFTDGNVTFDYSNYPMRQSFGGPTEGTARIGRIRYDSTHKTVEVANVEGDFWAAPLVRLFSSKTADKLETYRFHRPPSIHGSGIVDVTPEKRTTLDIRFRSDSPADYRFLGQNITVRNPSGTVAIRGNRVVVDNLSLSAFGGPVNGRFDSKGNGRLEGELTWTRVSIPSIASTYGFTLEGGGLATGRIEFSLQDSNVQTMDGKGLFGLENTELFSVPTFGPLSVVVGSVLNDRKIAFERATDAFCNFSIERGVLSTSDFQTSTNNLNFVGDGSVDMNNLTLDMTMRMNARGLLGLLTIPLRPLYGMFQFRGTGPLKHPEWKSEMFTTPTPRQKELLMNAPRATVIPERE